MTAVETTARVTPAIRPATPAQETDRWQPWRESLKVALLARAVAFAVALAAAWFLNPEGQTPATFAEMWRRWDAHHLLTIASVGYTDPASDAHAAAFFPLFPLIVRTLTFVGIPVVIGGLLVSFAATVVAGAFLYRLAEESAGEGAGRRAQLYLAFFPTAVFLIAPYSESLFLAGAIPAFYYARRGEWPLVGLPAAVAMGARAAGLFLLVGLVFEFLRRRDFSRHTALNAGLAGVIALLPLLAFAAFLSQAMGDPLAYIEAQREGWGRDLVGPVDSFLATWRTWEGSYSTNWLLAWRVEIVAAVVGVAGTIWALFKREWGYAAFMGSMMAVLISSTWYYSIPRMLLTMFPLVLFVAGYVTKRPRLHEPVFVCSAALAAMGVVVYTGGSWFY